MDGSSVWSLGCLDCPAKAPHGERRKGYFSSLLADNAPSVRAILTTLKPKQPLAIISADRDYRQGHIERIAGDLGIEFIHSKKWTIEKYETLIEKIFKYGLLANYESVHYPKQFAGKLIGDSVAVATCRALNNFKPIETILKSIWRDANGDEKRSYAIASLAEHCYSGGLYYPILEKAHANGNLRNQLTLSSPLPLTYADDTDYVYALHPVIADKLLHMLAREKSDWLLSIFTLLANALAPFVNRKATIARTPEAKLAARLFSAEGVVRPLLGRHADSFFESSHDSWKWNSRYWEQRALLTQSSNLEISIQYARHAVAIEDHPFPWTTLASLLGKKLESDETLQTAVFEEILELLVKVVRFEAASRSWRPTPHPYSILFHSIAAHKRSGGSISPKNTDWIKQQIEYCKSVFARDGKLLAEAQKVTQLLKK